MAMSRALDGRSVTSRPSMIMAPFPTCSRPATIRSSVDFPQLDVVQNLHVAEGLRDVLDLDRCHAHTSQVPHHTTAVAWTQRASSGTDRNRQVSVRVDQSAIGRADEDCAEGRWRNLAPRAAIKATP